MGLADQTFPGSLAMANLYCTLAMVFHRCDLELHDTIRERDVDIVRDCFLGEVRHDSTGIKVKRKQNVMERQANVTDLNGTPRNRRIS